MKTFLLTLMALVLLPLTSNAEGVSFKTERGNIYSAGGSINITEDASNDIVAAGGNVVITGSAGNELLAAGGSVLLSGKIAGDARVAGGNITIADEIGGEAVVAGGKVNLLPKAVIKSDLFAASGDISIEGTIGGGARIIGGMVLINGTINKNVDIKAQQLVIGKNAIIKGTLRYEAPVEARIEQGAVITGEKIFKKKEFAPPREQVKKFLGLWWIVKLIAVMAAALAIYFMLRKKSEQLTALALDRFGRELLTGFLVFVAIPALILLLFITVLGWLLGLISLFFYIAFITLSTVLGAVVFSGLLGKYVFKREQYLTWPVILLGVLIYQVIGLIPLLGWIFKFAFLLAALGALSHSVYSIREQN